MGLGAIKRFGARYGRSVKEKFGLIESEHRKFFECPGCLAMKVKRLSPGIWQCRKCGLKFAGKAYTISKKISIREEATPAPEKKEESKYNKDAEYHNSHNPEKIKKQKAKQETKQEEESEE